MNKLAQNLKEQALKKWRWLSRNPGFDEEDYYSGNTNLSSLSSSELCEYADSLDDGTKSFCMYCPLYGKWRGGHKFYDVCNEENTYFMRYQKYMMNMIFTKDDIKMISGLASKVADNIEQEWQDRDISHMVTERSGK